MTESNLRAHKRRLRQAETEYAELENEFQQLTTERVMLKRKVAFFQEELAIGAGPAKKFELMERLGEAERRVETIDARQQQIHLRMEDLEMQMQPGDGAVSSVSSTGAGETAVNLPQLREKLAQSFSTDELRILAFDLGLDFEEFASPTSKTTTAVGLIQQVQREGRLGELIAAARQKRPNGDF